MLEGTILSPYLSSNLIPNRNLEPQYRATQLSKPLRSILLPLAQTPEAHRPENGKLCNCEALCISHAF